MEATLEKHSTEIPDILNRKDPNKVLSHTLICGICTEKFDNLSIFLRHFRSHSTLPSQNFHLCTCLYESDLTLDKSEKYDPYKCRICETTFTSICTLHNHVLNCSADGSYIFDNTRKMVYPLSLHCSYFQSKDNDMSDNITEDYVNGIGKENEGDLSTNSFSNEMSRAEKVDHILRSVCKLFERNEKDKTENITSVESKKVERKKGRPKKLRITDGISMATEVQEERKKRKRNKDDKQYQEEITETIEKIQADEINDIVVKVEVEENSFCNANSDINYSKKSSDMCSVSDKHNDLPDAKNDGGGDDDDDGGDLTDEYTPENIKLESKIQWHTEEIEKKMSLKVSQLAKEVNTQKLKERRKKLKNTSNEKRGGLKKADEECPHCGKFMKPYRMKIHLISHMETRPFQCDLCPKSYKYQNHLEYHKASHEDVKPFYCEICGKGYLTITMLKHHSMMHHSDSKPCVCNICGASFITNYKLKRHMTKHTGEKSVQCDLCGMGFSTRYNLSVHIKGVHKKDHRFTCTECGKQFMTNYQLKVHTMKHSGERPYKCAVCKAEYIERKELRRHLKKQHNLPLEENTNTLSELLEGYDPTKTSSSKVAQQISALTGQAYSQILEQTEASAASDYITAENENLYSYTTTDECHSAPYYPVIKNSSVKVLPASDYQMVFPSTQDYQYVNPAGELTSASLPLTVQELHDHSRYHSSINEHCAAKDLSKNREEKLNINGSSQHNMGINKHLASQDKGSTMGSHDKLVQNFTVL